MKFGEVRNRNARERRRQARQNPRAHAAVRGDHADLPLDLEALAHHAREVVEHLGQIAARLALRQHRGDEEPGVEHRHPHGHGAQRLGSDIPKFCSS